ncbi:hypothetical protein [Yaniella flava]
MEMIPWFAWIAIVAIIVWGMVMIFGKSSNMSKYADRDEEWQRDIDSLRRRIEDLEAQLYRRG